MKQYLEILNDAAARVSRPDEAAMRAARERQSRLAKPPGSLGKLEELSVALAGITGKINPRFDRKLLITFCSDNGVTAQGVSVSPKEITRIQAQSLAAYKTGAGVIAASVGCGVRVIDVGVDGETPPGVINRKISYGTGDISVSPAMSREDAINAMAVGIEAVNEAFEEGFEIVGVGELGIGNTATSSAVLAFLTGAGAAEVTGAGGGLPEGGLARKIEVIDRALARASHTDKNDVPGVIAQLGGYDIAAMAGAFIAGAADRIPMVVDGFISAVAALCAVRINENVRAYLIPSHRSAEKGYAAAVKELGLEPMLDLDMRLGEGSGCPIAMKIVDIACCVINDMATFDESGIDDGYLDAIRRGKGGGK